MKSKTEQYSLRLQYTAEASKFYCRKMEKLIERDKHELRGYIPDGKGGVRSELPATLMYRVDTLMSADANPEHCQHVLNIRYHNEHAFRSL